MIAGRRLRRIAAAAGIGLLSAGDAGAQGGEAVQRALEAVTGVRRFSIPSTSMFPALNVGDVIVTRPIGDGAKDLKPGQIVVFLTADGRTYFVSRIIGMPGDRVRMKAGRLFINGVQIPRERIADRPNPIAPDEGKPIPCYRETLASGTHEVCEASGDTFFLDDTAEFLVPPGHLFVMSDNRDNAVDSRMPSPVGFVPFARVRYRHEPANN